MTAALSAALLVVWLLGGFAPLGCSREIDNPKYKVGQCIYINHGKGEAWEVPNRSVRQVAFVGKGHYGLLVCLDRYGCPTKFDAEDVYTESFRSVHLNYDGATECPEGGYDSTRF